MHDEFRSSGIKKCSSDSQLPHTPGAGMTMVQRTPSGYGRFLINSYYNMMIYSIPASKSTWTQHFHNFVALLKMLMFVLTSYYKVMIYNLPASKVT